ncbi:hypothetical protein EJB05_54958 [Eragrostis curvula]|uniref:DUF6598 domain-containing protein n=1 Tax=Eragrostis curvula TaxID=38414 RepID=A0A5J9SKZ8_9POAL|nr:hypothetical protein EJB05_54958 [Eragrostis curvula]
MDDDGDEFAGLEPFFFDEAVVVAEHAAAEDKRRKKEQEEALKKEQRMQKAIAYQSVLDKITEYDPTLGCEYITRFYMADLSVFDLDEESPLGPMRYTQTQTTGEYGTRCRQGKKWFYPENSANVISVKISSSDVGFPIYAYGTVIARDSLDWKCLYLFNRDRDTCQVINYKLFLRLSLDDQSRIDLTIGISSLKLVVLDL